MLANYNSQNERNTTMSEPILPDSVIIQELRIEREDLISKVARIEWVKNSALLDLRKLTSENADLKKRVKELNDECEAQQYQFDILKKDPACVWANMLRGNIATPSALVEAHDYQQIKAENAALEAKVKVLREALRRQHENQMEECKVFFSQDDKPIDIETDLSEAYSESSLCEETINVLAETEGEE